MNKIVTGLCILASMVYAAPQKVTYADVAGKNYYSKYNDPTYGLLDIRVQYFSNMNFKTQVNFFGWNDADINGEWAIENGVVTIEGIPNNDVNKSIATLQPDFDKGVIITNISGRGEIITEDTMPLVGIDDIVGDITPPYEVSIAELQGKKMTLGTEVLYLFNNMTAAMVDGSTTIFMGTWKVENGVLVLDGGWEDRDGSGTVIGVATETFSMLFSAAPAAGTKIDVWTNAARDPDGTGINIDAFGEITAADAIPAPFNNDPVPYVASVEEFAGKRVVVEYLEEGSLAQTEITFNDNMTFRSVDYFNTENPDVSTGIWSVEEGVLILDTVYNDHYVLQHAIVLSEKPANGVAYDFIGVEVSDSATEGEGVGVYASSGKAMIKLYPTEDTSSASPAVIMYLLN